MLSCWTAATEGVTATRGFYAAWMRERSRPIPVIMFTAHTGELAEARLGVSERSKSAAFVGFLSKPFDLRILVETVSRVVEEPAAVRALLPRSAADLIGQLLKPQKPAPVSLTTPVA